MLWLDYLSAKVIKKKVFSIELNYRKSWFKSTSFKTGATTVLPKSIQLIPEEGVLAVRVAAIRILAHLH